LELAVLSNGRLDLGVAAKGRLSLPVRLLRSANGFEDRELQRRIDARRFPTIDGELTDITETGKADRYRVRGDITFRGVTRSCESQMSITHLDENTVRLEGRSRFDIREFGMDPPRMLLLRVHPEVEVAVVIVAVKED
jgi:polyisoprenoid-binding protein YceI